MLIAWGTCGALVAQTTFNVVCWNVFLHTVVYLFVRLHPKYVWSAFLGVALTTVGVLVILEYVKWECRQLMLVDLSTVLDKSDRVKCKQLFGLN